MAGATFVDKMGPPAGKSIKSWYQVSEDDKMIPPEVEKKFASHSQCDDNLARGSYASLVSRWKEVAELILVAVKS